VKNNDHNWIENANNNTTQTNWKTV